MGKKCLKQCQDIFLFLFFFLSFMIFCYVFTILPIFLLIYFLTHIGKYNCKYDERSQNIWPNNIILSSFLFSLSNLCIENKISPSYKLIHVYAMKSKWMTIHWYSSKSYGYIKCFQFIFTSQSCYVLEHRCVADTLIYYTDSKHFHCYTERGLQFSKTKKKKEKSELKLAYHQNNVGLICL